RFTRNRPLHISLLVVIILAKNNRSCSYGVAKYKPSSQISHTIKWKHFFSSNEPPQPFNPGDIVFLSGKYVVENSEKYMTIAYASIIDARKPECEFDMKVSLLEYNAITGSSNIKMEMIVLYIFQSVRFKHLGLLGINIKTANNYLISGFIKFSDSGKILIEATDIDYQKSSIYTPTASEISPDKSQKTCSIIDIIADDIESTPKQKNDSNLEAENNNEEQQNDSNLEAENDNEEQLNDNEEEKGSLINENIKMTDVSEDEDQSKKRKTSVSEED
ncbi:24911_t:CDS:2, partial [Gigaspora margarita]